MLVQLVTRGVQHAHHEGRYRSRQRTQEQRAEHRELGRVRKLAQHDPRCRARCRGWESRRTRRSTPPTRRPAAQTRLAAMVGSSNLKRSPATEPGANPGRSRRCEGRRSSPDMPLAVRPGRWREGAPSQKTCRPPTLEPLAEGGSCFDAPARLRGALLAALVLVGGRPGAARPGSGRRARHRPSSARPRRARAHDAPRGARRRQPRGVLLPRATPLVRRVRRPDRALPALRPQTGSSR